MMKKEVSEARSEEEEEGSGLYSVIFHPTDRGDQHIDIAEYRFNLRYPFKYLKKADIWSAIVCM